MSPNPINTILLHPTDVLFFRDGRPMEGALAGNGAAWPLPNVTDAAFHAALHRSGLEGHKHDQRHNAERHGKDNRRYGSLVTAGPFPVRVVAEAQAWYFPRPLDLVEASLQPALLPVRSFDPAHSSLPDPLEYAVANSLPPSKDNAAKTWLHRDAYQRYIDGAQPKLAKDEALDDSAFGGAESAVGIAIDPKSGSTGQGEAEGAIYSARYLRLRDDWRLGVFAKTDEKDPESSRRSDLVLDLFQQPQHILVGGQQRLCSATRCDMAHLPLPIGKSDGFSSHGEGAGQRWLVKWILLSPAIWPEIPGVSKDGRPMVPHCGGWLPNWVRQSDGQVMLRSGDREKRRYNGKHSRGFAQDAGIDARLVAAIVPKPIPVTGWALANDVDRAQGGAKSLHHAVPAGAVYYFEASSSDAARDLSVALNWHGANTTPTTIFNRRSTLMGEKGFGLGVCGTWNFLRT